MTGIVYKHGHGAEQKAGRWVDYLDKLRADVKVIPLRAKAG